jgi:hypothetical protein
VGIQDALDAYWLDVAHVVLLPDVHSVRVNRGAKRRVESRALYLLVLTGLVTTAPLLERLLFGDHSLLVGRSISL